MSMTLIEVSKTVWTRLRFDIAGSKVDLQLSLKDGEDITLDIIKKALVGSVARAVFNDDVVVFEYDDWESSYEVLRVVPPFSTPLLVMRPDNGLMISDRRQIRQLFDKLFDGYRIVSTKPPSHESKHYFLQKDQEIKNGIV